MDWQYKQEGRKVLQYEWKTLFGKNLKCFLSIYVFRVLVILLELFLKSNYTRRRIMDNSKLLQKYENFLEGVNDYLEMKKEYDMYYQQYIDSSGEEKRIRGKVPGVIWFSMIVFGVIGTAIFPVVATIIGGLIGYVIGCVLAVLLKTDDKFERKADEYRDSTVVPLASKCQQCQELIDEHMNSSIMQQFYSEVPEDYRTISALEFFVKMLRNRQAETEKELYNLYMEYSQRQQMIDMQNQQIILSQETLAQQKEQIEATLELNKTAQQQQEILDNMAKKQKKISKQVRYGNVVNTLDYFKKK